MDQQPTREQLRLALASGQLNANEEQLAHDVLRTLDSLQEMREGLTTGAHRYCRSVLGDRYEEALRHPEFALRYLSDEDPNVRYAALTLMQVAWGNAREHESTLRRLAVSDPDERVRTTAFGYLGMLLAKQPDRGLGTMLAKLVCDETQSRRMRRSAYLFLARMFSLPLSAHGNAGMVNLATEVDWSLVRELAGETNGDRSGTVGDDAVAFELPGVGT